MEQPKLKRPSVSQPPQVSWLDPEDRDDIPDVWVTQVTVQQLVNSVWQRIPEAAWAIIAPDLDGVRLVKYLDLAEAVHDENYIVLSIGDHQGSPQWELTMMWLLARSFGYTFLWTVAGRMVGNAALWVPLPDEDQDTPTSAWWRSFYEPAEPANAYKEMTNQAATALAVG
jgi:hypothetical protein